MSNKKNCLGHKSQLSLDEMFKLYDIKINDNNTPNLTIPDNKNIIDHKNIRTDDDISQSSINQLPTKTKLNKSPYEGLLHNKTKNDEPLTKTKFNKSPYEGLQIDDQISKNNKTINSNITSFEEFTELVSGVT